MFSLNSIFFTIIFIIITHNLFFKLGIKNYFKKSNNLQRWGKNDAYLIGGFIFISFFIYLYILGYFKITNFFLNIYELFILLIFFLVGFYDDKFNLNGKIKLILYFLVIVGLTIYYLDDLNYLHIFLIGLILFFVFVALNIIDNMDGNFSLFFLIFTSYFIIINFSYFDLYVSSLMGILLVNIYFLFINIFKGKNYLGDSGSYLLSGFIIIIFLKYRDSIDINRTIYLDSIILLNLFAYPIYDLIYVSVKRISNGKSPLAGGTDHTSHVFSKLFVSDFKSLIVIGFANIIYYSISLYINVFEINLLLNFLLIIIFYIFLSILTFYQNK